MTLLPIPNSVILSDRHCTENYLRNIIYVDIKFHDLLTHWPWAPRIRRRACAVWCPRTLRTTPTWPRWSRCKCSCAPVQRAFPSWDPWHWNFINLYRVSNQLANLGWSWLVLAIPLSAWFCLVRWKLGRIGWAAGQYGWNIQMKVNPTQVHQVHQAHYQNVPTTKQFLTSETIWTWEEASWQPHLPSSSSCTLRRSSRKSCPERPKCFGASDRALPWTRSGR